MVFSTHSQLILDLIFCLNYFFISSGFLVHMRHFDIDFLFFLIFLSDFFKNGFINSLIVHSRSSFSV